MRHQNGIDGIRMQHNKQTKIREMQQIKQKQTRNGMDLYK